MSASLSAFSLPDDGWFHIAVPGEWPHKPTGLLQVLDDDALASIVQNFTENSTSPNWPGVLIDFDHQSLDQDKPTVAAGWIVSLDKRPNGIWAQIRWSDLGRKSIEGGRYRFISPVWRSTDCAMLGEDRIRPLKLMNCAVTNDPNIKGLFPLSNAASDVPLRFTPPAIPLPVPANDKTAQPIANGRPLTDEQRRAIWAKGGGGGGGRGGAQPRGTGPTRSAPTPTQLGTPTPPKRDFNGGDIDHNMVELARQRVLRQQYEKSVEGWSGNYSHSADEATAKAKRIAESMKDGSAYKTPREIQADEDARERAKGRTLPNRQRSDEELKAIHASRGGGGGGGGWASRAGGSPASPTSNYAGGPESGPTPGERYLSTRDHEARIKHYEENVAELETMRKPKPTPPPRMEYIDPRKAEQDAMKKPNATATDAINARRAAEEQNAYNQAIYRDIKKRAEKKYTSKSARERAIQREIDDMQKDYEEALSDWYKYDSKIDTLIRTEKDKIAQERIRLGEAQSRATNLDDEAVRKQAVKDQVARDKAIERERIAKERADREKKAADKKADTDAQREATAPLREYRSERNRRSAYVDAIRYGDMDFAERLYPGADHAAVTAQIEAVTSATGAYDVKKVDRLVADLKRTAPPMLTP